MASFKSLSPGEVQSKTEFSTSQDSCVNIPARISIFFSRSIHELYVYTVEPRAGRNLSSLAVWSLKSRVGETVWGQQEKGHS